MKKIYYILISLIIILCTASCAGYKPIFGSSNLGFKITDHTIKGDEKLGNKIYAQLYSLSKRNIKTGAIKNIKISIDVTKNKTATAKNSAGKILGYKINIISNITLKDAKTNDQILNKTFNYSVSYKVQDQYSETIKLEEKSVQNLINKTYQDLLIKISQNI